MFQTFSGPSPGPNMCLSSHKIPLKIRELGEVQKSSGGASLHIFQACVSEDCQEMAHIFQLGIN